MENGWIGRGYVTGANNRAYCGEVPLDSITGLLGINLAGIPGAEYYRGFALVTLINVILVLVHVVIFPVVIYQVMKWL